MNPLLAYLLHHESATRIKDTSEEKYPENKSVPAILIRHEFSVRFAKREVGIERMKTLIEMFYHTQGISEVVLHDSSENNGVETMILTITSELHDLCPIKIVFDGNFFIVTSQKSEQSPA